MKTLEFFIGKFHDLAKQCQIVEASHQIESAKGSFVRLPYKPILVIVAVMSVLPSAKINAILAFSQSLTFTIRCP